MPLHPLHFSSCIPSDLKSGEKSNQVSPEAEERAAVRDGWYWWIDEGIDRMDGWKDSLIHRLRIYLCWFLIVCSVGNQATWFSQNRY